MQKRHLVKLALASFALAYAPNVQAHHGESQEHEITGTHLAAAGCGSPQRREDISYNASNYNPNAASYQTDSSNPSGSYGSAGSSYNPQQGPRSYNPQGSSYGSSPSTHPAQRYNTNPSSSSYSSGNPNYSSGGTWSANPNYNPNPSNTYVDPNNPSTGYNPNPNRY